MKYCPQCEAIMPVDEFGKNRAKDSGLTSYCLACHNAVMTEQRIRRDGSTRNFHLKRRYGLTEAEVDEMIARQGGKCMARAISYVQGRLPRLPPEERISDGKVEIILGRLDDGMKILLAEDYAHV